MTNEWTGTMIIDEIDRLTVTYNKAKEYLTTITSGIEQQIDIWQHRQQVIRDQIESPSSSYGFLLPKTQRINELTLEAVQALCRADLLIEQILRIDPKSLLTSISTRPSIPNGNFNGQSTIPMPVLRTQPQISSGRSSTTITQEKIGSEPAKRETISHPQNDGHYYTRPLFGTRTPQPGRMTPVSTYPSRQQTRIKEKIKLQRIPPGTKWKQAKIDIIDSLSGFYVGNLDSKVHEKFLQMQDELHDYYNDLQRSNQLIPLENIAIGDFGVAKYSDDNRWYRARLISCEDQEQIKIVFVDFGNIEIKSLKDFFPLFKLFTDLPAQAIACSLSEAFPRSQNNTEAIWPEETIEIFRNEVTEKVVEIQFANEEEGTEKWPLHFVRIIVGNQSVTTLLSLQQRIDPRPNRFIADEMTPSLSQEEYILFNVRIGDDDLEQ